MKEEMPFASIIIPVRDNKPGLLRVLHALKNQDYPNHRHEVIIVDNGSKESLKSVTEDAHAIYLNESTYLNSPYSARNRGLEIAKGEIIVLLDATCAPTREWLTEGVCCLSKGADLVGGEIEFDITEKSSLAQIYDSLFNVRMKHSILDRKVAKAGNIFIRRSVFDKIGVFPEGLRSGGDVRWTNMAVKAGFKLDYAEKAKATIMARGFTPLLKKLFRVAKGHPAVWKETGTVLSNSIKKILLCWLPPNPAELKKRVEEQNLPFVKRRFFSLYLLGWFIRLVSGVGHISGFFLTNKVEHR